MKKATSPAEERQDVTVLYNKMTIGELQNTFSFNVRFTLFCSILCYKLDQITVTFRET